MGGGEENLEETILTRGSRDVSRIRWASQRRRELSELRELSGGLQVCREVSQILV